MVRQKFVLAVCMLAVLLSGAAVAQQATPDLWKLVPADSMVVAGFDGRPGNPSIQAMERSQSPEVRQMLEDQQAAMRKGIEDMATLFGVSLDFAKDIESWEDPQWAFVLQKEGKEFVPLFMAASKDPAAATAAMQKMLAPWGRLGELRVIETDSTEIFNTPPMMMFQTKDKKMKVFAAAAGPVIAMSTSQKSVQSALSGKGFAAGTAGAKALSAVSGSLFYAFADPALAKDPSGNGIELPVTGIAMGMSVVDAGYKVQVIGYPTAEGAAMVKQFATLNPGGPKALPSNALIAASLPDMTTFLAMMHSGGESTDPASGLFDALTGTQVSAAMTAVLPLPSGVAVASAASEQDAAAKLAKITASLKQMKLATQPAVNVAGVSALPFTIKMAPKNDQTMYLAQAGSNILLATDAQSLAAAAAAAAGQPGVAESETYKSTMANVGPANVMTMYMNLAPIQGLGYLAEGLGVAQMEPFYGMMARSLQGMQAAAIGVGFDGEAVNATMFLRAKPGMETSFAPVMASATAMGAAILFPVFSSARDRARQSTCASNLKQLSLAAIMYADDNGKLPAANAWRSQLKPYIKNADIMQCPDGSLYAFNKNLGGLNLDKIQNQPDVVLFFEASPSLPNAIGSRKDAILPHGGKGWFAYADGHVKMSSEVPEQWQWVPKYEQPKPAVKKPVVKKPVVRKK